MGTLRQKLWYYSVIGIVTTAASGLQLVRWAMDTWCDYLSESRNRKEGR